MNQETEIHETTGIDPRKLGIWLLIGAEVIFFGSLIGAYLQHYATNRPAAHEVLDVPLTTLTTFVLITSSLMMVLALDSIRKGDRRKMQVFLMATAFFGLLFLMGQFFEFTELWHEGITPASGMFGATFMTLTGFHGTHVLIGIIWIFFLLVRAIAGGVTQANHLAVELVGLYWHFVDLVWIVIFTVVYLI
ncbi:MAG: Cytochrome c oxidase subunit 3 [Anaerolineales bacterium]|nr:Cytochrome c oxidase subunit 3 [Anaerolineales bacterium]